MSFAINWNQVEVGKDDNGCYVLIPLGDKQDPLKVYVEEMFEDFVGQKVDLSMNTMKHGGVPFENTAEATAAMERLNLREVYPKVREDLNVFNFLAKKYKGSKGTLGFQAVNPQDMEEFKAWQKRVQAKLNEMLHLPFPAVPLNVEWGPEAQFDGLVYKKLYYSSQPDLKVPAVLAYREDLDLAKKHPAVVTLHGHNYGKVNTLGFSKSASDSYYGRELAERGFVTLSLDQWGWGERYGQATKRLGSAEHNYSLSSLIVGLNAIGIRAWDVSKGLDFLETLNFVDPTRFGTCGQSGGGTTSLFAAATDARVKAAVVSGYFCTFYDSIFALSHCGCNYIPDIALYFDMADILGSRAPLPVFVVSGENDGIYPKHGVAAARKVLEEIYAFAGAPESFQIDILKGQGHMFSGRKSYPWLEAFLKAL